MYINIYIYIYVVDASILGNCLQTLSLIADFVDTIVLVVVCVMCCLSMLDGDNGVELFNNPFDLLTL